MNSTTIDTAELDRDECEAYNGQRHLDTMRQHMTWGERHEHGEWARPQMTSLPIWHLFPGYVLEARLDSRIAALLDGEDVVVVSAPQHTLVGGGHHWSGEHTLVEGVDTGRLATLSAPYKTRFYATVPPFAAHESGFHAQTQTQTYPLATVACSLIKCDEHGWQTLFDHSGSGFAGGWIVHIELSCGCVEHDESDDMRAAR